MTRSEKLSGLLLFIVIFMSLNTREVLAQETLKKGNKAPSFTLKDQDGHDFRLADHIGKHNVVIFFYPQDKSPICTKEACTFRDAYQKYKEANAIVVGINSGTIESHKAFHTTEHLPFDLLSDPDNKVLSLFGVKEQDFGKVKVTGRETFVIGKDGLVVYSFRDFMKGDEHSNQVLAYLTGNK